MHALLAIAVSLISFSAQAALAQESKGSASGAHFESELSLQETLVKSAASFSKNLKQGSVSKYKCTEIKLLRGTILCVFSDQDSMAKALARASLFAEGAGNLTAGTAVAKQMVISESDARLKNYRGKMAGFDIEGANLLSFYSQASDACRVDSMNCPNDREKEFFEKIVLPLEKLERPFVVITAVRIDFPILIHEAYHARYFLDESYRSAIDSFWQSMTADEKAAVRFELEGYYLLDDESHVAIEMQAYFFTPGGGPFKEIIHKLAPRLIRHLHSLKVKPL